MSHETLRLPSSVFSGNPSRSEIFLSHDLLEAFESGHAGWAGGGMVSAYDLERQL